MPVQRCKRETTSSEFVKWLAYMEMEEMQKINAFNPDHYYLAQIAQMIIQSVSKKRTHLKQFLLKFSIKKKVKSEKKLSMQERLKRGKAAWFAAVGLKRKK